MLRAHFNSRPPRQNTPVSLSTPPNPDLGRERRHAIPPVPSQRKGLAYPKTRPWTSVLLI